MMSPDYLTARNYARWLKMNEVPEEVDEQWRMPSMDKARSGPGRHLRRLKVNAAARAFGIWVGEQLESLGYDDMPANRLVFIRIRDDEPYGPNNYLLVRRLPAKQLAAIKEERALTQRDIDSALEDSIHDGHN